MTNSSGRALVRAHKLMGLAAGLVVLTVTTTGLLLLHPGLLGPPDNSPAAYAADPGRPGHWLRGGELGLDISDDDGRTWREAPMLRPPDGVVRLAFGPDGAAWALGRDILLVSRDGGAIWERVDLPPASGAIWRDPVDLVVAADRVDVVTRGGLIRSEDAGRTWTVTAWADPPPDRGLRGWIHDLHTGWAFGRTGRDVVTAGSIALLIITLSGFLLSSVGRRRKRNGH